MASVKHQREEALQVTSYPALQRFLQQVSPAQLLLASDFDGTLSKIVADPDTAKPLPGVLDELRSLSSRLRAIAVVSGRSTTDLERLLPIDGLIRLGDYGLAQPTPGEQRALRKFNARMRALVDARAGLALEEKPGSTSVHFRHAPESGDSVFRLVSDEAARDGLKASAGRMVVEVRPPRAGKGAAIARLVDQLQPGGVLFAGDDEGDRDAFEVLATIKTHHLAIGIRSPETDPGLFERCDLVVDGPEEFSRCLRTLAAWAGRPGRARPGSDA